MKALSTVLCNNILERGLKDQIPVSPMKLQKLMYYVCRDYLKLTGEMPIDEYFEVWKYGPVLRSVYNEFNTYGANPIRDFSKDARGKSYKVSEDDNPVLKRIIDIVWAKYKDFNGIMLSQKTHQSNSGWYAAYISNRHIITLEDMMNDSTE